MNQVTYSLYERGNNSDNYYETIRSFSREVICEAEKSIYPFIQDYIKYLREFGLEDIRDEREYLLELLSFGVLWRTYSGTALATKHAPFVTMARLGEWRKKHQKLKPCIDWFRGVLTTAFLLGKEEEYDPYPTFNKIDHLCKWLEATGEFREQALRFIRWRAYWGTKEGFYLIPFFNEVRKFTSWFITESERVLGKYTEQVEPFLKVAKVKYKWREDRISCSRSRAEYHLNMVGAELMNNAFHKEFKETEKKYVLLPGCMRIEGDKCKGKRIKEGVICTDCSDICKVNQLRKMGIREGFEVAVIPHASDLSLWGPKQGCASRGVIASACVTTLVEGGWELKRYGVPAQCVLLDYCGCKKHWHPEGVPTKLNVKELNRINLN